MYVCRSPPSWTYIVRSAALNEDDQHEDGEGTRVIRPLGLESES